jgi:hypothetical protein
MARKRKKDKDLRGVSPYLASYWEEILQRESLQMARGRHERLSYVGTPQHLEKVAAMHETDIGRVTPKHGSE